MPEAQFDLQTAHRGRALLQQRRLLLAGAMLIGAYYLTFAAIGVYPVPSFSVGLGIPVLLAAAAWRLPGASPRAEAAWLLAVTIGMSALAIGTAALANGTACLGFHAVWAFPLIYTLLVPTSVAASWAGSATAIVGGLALLIRDGHPPVHLAQWGAMAVGAAIFSAHRVELNRRDQTALLDHEARRETRLQKMEDRYRLLAEHTRDVIWTLDLATRRLSFVSPSVTRQRGVTVEEALRQGLADSLLPESLARVIALIGSIGSGKEPDPHTGLYQQRCKDGSVIDVEITATLVRDQDGRPIEVAGVSRDVTARVAAERALRRSEERFRALIEKSTDIILVVDREGVVQFWSPSGTEGLGWPADAVVGRAWTALGVIHPDDEPAVAQAMAELLARDRATRSLRVRFRHADGSWRMVEGEGRNLVEDPAVGGLVINARDITAQHRLEEHVRQAQKLESIGRLAGGVAHDFNNLLTVMLSCGDAIQRDAADGKVPDQEDLHELRAAGGRARELTRQLLAFARRQSITPVPVDLNEVVRRSEGLLRRVLGEDVLLKVEPGPGLGAVLCDPSQLDQVILNLAVNARDAMPRGGVLTIATRAVRVGPGVGGVDPDQVPGDWIQLDVRDTGVGLSPEVKAHLFEPFFTTKAKGQGTGLGLATVYGIVRQSGGHVHVESEPGRGASFRVCLPRLPEAAPTPRPTLAPTVAPAPRASGAEALLVVEDDELVRGVTLRVLKGAGYRVQAAASGAEALELSGSWPEKPALLVTDVVMPGLGGREVAEALRQRWPELRVLFVSGYTRDAIGARELAVPHTSFLAKPFTPEGLLEQVRNMIDA